MEKTRGSFQGVANIIRFNWHFYFLSLSLVLLLYGSAQYINHSFQGYLYLICILILSITIISLSVSYYVYDRSGLYNFTWIAPSTEKTILNINAGFDETSWLLGKKFKDAKLIALDFYDPLKHTEVSIKRARKAYPVYPGTITVKTSALQMADNSTDKIFVIFSAHEIRDENERVAFFKELRRIIKPNGKIYIVEHLRDTANFLAYNIGFVHFYSKSTWHNIFQSAQLNIQNELKLNPFISTFILGKNGSSL